MPPATDAAVQTPAITQARPGLARTIGISITSGVIGKNELSAKLTMANAHIALGRCASRSMWS